MPTDPDHPGPPPPDEGVDPDDAGSLRRWAEARPEDWRGWFRLGLRRLAEAGRAGDGRQEPSDADPGRRDPDGPGPAAVEAVDALRRAVELTPENGLARYHLARAQVRARRYGEALHSVREATRLRPGFAPAWRLLGILLGGRGAWEDALAAWQRAARSSPDGETWWQIGRCLVRLRRFREAVVALEEAVRVDPEHRRAHQGLALLGRLRNEPDVTLRHLRRLFEIDEELARELAARLR